MYKIEDLNGEKIKWIFYEKWLLLSKLYVSYYPEPNSLIRNKGKIVLHFLKYATK